MQSEYEDIKKLVPQLTTANNLKNIEDIVNKLIQPDQIIGTLKAALCQQVDFLL